ncbi:hypothetical protein [Bradyrhizobium sp. STM 3843]|uniref:hypothetical protein n=1 Tax=Bradyrhizobium sp. STM 3843 TaxID=551947 RepID=UPI00241409F0|nr:hypothetical protein [Bradyrhizobium sp. STM 3843]
MHLFGIGGGVLVMIVMDVVIMIVQVRALRAVFACSIGFMMLGARRHGQILGPDYGDVGRCLALGSFGNDAPCGVPAFVMLLIMDVVVRMIIIVIMIMVVVVMMVVTGMMLVDLPRLVETGFAEALHAVGFGLVVVAVAFVMGLEAVTLGFVRMRLQIVGLHIMALEMMLLGLMAFGVRHRCCRLGPLDDFALDALAAAATSRTAMAIATPVRAALVFFLGFAMRALFGLDQRLPIRNRDLIIVGMDFAEREKAVAIAAIFHESGLQRRFDPRDLGEVDIAAQLLALGSLEIKLLDAIAADDNHPGLFRVGSIDQHLVGHIGTLEGDGRGWPRARGALSDDATVHLIRG